jgi:serine/threonine protein kinase
VHRDLKPGNIMLTDHGEVKVTDFGISGLLRRLGDLTEQGAMIGTPQYVAPEQLRDGSRVDPRADQYALAVIAYEMLTNALPVGAFETPSSLNPSIPREVDAILRKALAPNPADRFRSVREFVHEFAGRCSPPKRLPRPPRGARWGRRERRGGFPRNHIARAARRRNAPARATPFHSPGQPPDSRRNLGGVAVFLAAARIPSGQWILDPAIFEGAETARRLERLPLALVEAAGRRRRARVGLARRRRRGAHCARE